ncbi:MAG: SUF system Fe-S cluster assembly regulator [Kiloniellales bacterium]
MIKLNRMTDYAVVVMAQMAMRPDEVVTAAQVARDTGVPLPSVAKLMTALARAGLAASHRGVTGGYRLDRPAEEISVAEIITALEGPIALTACVHGALDQCDVESLCPMRGHWDKINQAIRRALQDLTLADMTPDLVFPVAPPDERSRGPRVGKAS